MPGFHSSRPNWVPPSPHSQGSVAPPPLWVQGGDTLASGGVGKGPNLDEGTDTLVLFVTIVAIILITVHCTQYSDKKKLGSDSKSYKTGILNIRGNT